MSVGAGVGSGVAVGTRETVGAGDGAWTTVVSHAHVYSVSEELPPSAHRPFGWMMPKSWPEESSGWPLLLSQFS